MDPEFLKCRICEKHLQPPIRRCATHSTHMFCEQCIINKNNKCTICQSTVPSTNDVALEALLNIQKYKCKNENCRKELSSLPKKLEHERNCKYEGGGSHKCAFNQFQNTPKACPWVGAYDQIEEHFHSTHLPPLAQNQIEINLSSTNTYTQLLKACSQLFWYKHFVDIEAQKVYFLMQVINYNEHNKFEFKIKFISLFDSNKTWTLKRDCYDADEDADAYFMAGRSINAGFKNLRPFIHENMVYIHFDIQRKTKLPKLNRTDGNSRIEGNKQGENENRSMVKGQMESEVTNPIAETFYAPSTDDNPSLPNCAGSINPPTYDEATNLNPFKNSEIDRSSYIEKNINSEIKNTIPESFYPASVSVEVEVSNHLIDQQDDNVGLLSNNLQDGEAEGKITGRHILIGIVIVIIVIWFVSQLNPHENY